MDSPASRGTPEGEGNHGTALATERRAGGVPARRDASRVENPEYSGGSVPNKEREASPGVVGATVYRLYDAGGALLYVGMTSRLEKRMTEHAAEKAWWPRVASREVEHFSDRSAAAVREHELIETQHPLYNGHGVYIDRSAGSPLQPREIRMIRMWFGLKQTALAKQLGTTQHTVNRWEAGINIPSGPAIILLMRLRERMVSEW